MPKEKKAILGVDYFIGVFYCSCIYESGFQLVSLHRSLKGASEGMSELKLKHHLENIEGIKILLSDEHLLKLIHQYEEGNIEEIERAYNLSLFDSIQEYIDIMIHDQGRMSYFTNSYLTAYKYQRVFLKD